MSTAQIRHWLYEYIRFANEKKIKAIYTMVEEEIKENHDVWTKEFVREMERRAKDIETGKIKGRNRTEVSRKIRSLVGK